MDISDENFGDVSATVEHSPVNAENPNVKNVAFKEANNSVENDEDASANSVPECGDMNEIGETIKNETTCNGNEHENSGLESCVVITDKQNGDDDNANEASGHDDYQTEQADVGTDNQTDAADLSSQFMNNNHAIDVSAESDNAVAVETSEHSISLRSNAAVVPSQLTEEPHQETADANSEKEEPNQETVDVIAGETTNSCDREPEPSEMVETASAEGNENNGPLSCVQITTVFAPSGQEASSLAVKTETTTTVHILSSNENGVVTADDEDGTENVILSDEEAKLLEKLKYQPFDVAQVSNLSLL